MVFDSADLPDWIVPMAVPALAVLGWLGRVLISAGGKAVINQLATKDDLSDCIKSINTNISNISQEIKVNAAIAATKHAEYDRGMERINRMDSIRNEFSNIAAQGSEKVTANRLLIEKNDRLEQEIEDLRRELGK